MTKWLIGLFCLIFTNIVGAEELAILQGTEAFREGDSFVTELKFSQPVDAKGTSLEFINQTVQLNIKGATISTGKDIKRLEDEKIKSVFTYQYEPDLMRTRIIYHSTDAQTLNGHVKVEANGNTLRVVVNDPAGVKNEERTAAAVTHLPPIDLDRELDKALKLEAPEVSDEEAELMAAASQIGVTSEDKVSSKVEEDRTTAEAPPAKESDIALGKVESEIPLNINTKEAKAEASSPWTRLLISLVVISIVGMGLIVGVKRYAKDKVQVGGNIKVKVVSQHPLGPKKSLAVIHVAGESILIGITDHNISMIKSLALIDDEIEEEVPSNFDQEIAKASAKDTYRPSSVNKVSQNVAQKSATEAEDEFSIGSIKDLVSSKLKEMRPL